MSISSKTKPMPIFEIEPMMIDSNPVPMKDDPMMIELEGSKGRFGLAPNSLSGL